ncbi:hypothetical protein ASG56_10845 [Rhodococcus sp. Leaf7]|uniref:DUF3558 family protein n=1 Tax=unclassified Rhodococcus (in: high G+C Gram-positive bacteria) TaxID=192944 RepID=UPI0006FFEB93|nr:MULTISPECIES: DUF3558 family protein [unclassified Rhodococcus (in: high G+C Gram-positive bacteria)]KQU03927.1 hypothetical protein ASG56_10845 [Rhodococcus sp. Leaf7]KQU40111.1 hypothetical protein ASG64_10840 [Rhodococcus sp. Leaf247]
MLTGGCSTGVAGTPVAELWDPCTIPSEAIEAAGVDPTVVDVRSVGLEDNKWRYCTFRQDWFYLTVLSTGNSLDEIRSSQNARQIVDWPIEGRTAISYFEENATTGLSCFTSFEVAQGAVEFEVSRAGDARSTGDACELSRSIADALNHAVPQ